MVPSPSTFAARMTVLGLVALAFVPLAVDAQPTSAVADLPSRRYGTGAVWDGSHAYVFGGHDGAWTRFDQVVRFDPQTNEVVIMGGKLPSGRYAASAVWTGSEAYLFGGQGPTLLAEIVRYDPSTDTVTVMSAALPTPRAFTSAVWDGTHAYVFGGLQVSNGSYGNVDEIVRYTPATNTVVVLDAALPSTRSGTSAVWDGENVFVIGGVHYNDWITEIVRFTPATGAVELLPASLPTKRDFTSAVWTGSDVQIFGGRSRTANYAEILRFDPAAGTVAVRTAILPSPRFETSAVWTGTEAFVFGGAGSGIIDEIVRVGGDPPTPPRALRAAPEVGVTLLVWDPPADEGDAPVTAYRVYGGTGGVADTLLAELPSDARSYRDGACRVRSECTYAVTAVNENGESAASPRATAPGTQPCIAYTPSAATNVCLATKGSTQFTRPDVEVSAPALDPDSGPCVVGDLCAPGVDGGVELGTRQETVPYDLSGYVEVTALCARAPSACRATLP